MVTSGGESWRKHIHLPLYHNFQDLFWDRNANVSEESVNRSELSTYIWTNALEKPRGLQKIDLGPVDGTGPPMDLKNAIALDRHIPPKADDIKQLLEQMRQTHELRKTTILQNRQQLQKDLEDQEISEVLGISRDEFPDFYNTGRRLIYDVFVPQDDSENKKVPVYLQGMDRAILIMMARSSTTVHSGERSHDSESEGFLLVEERPLSSEKTLHLQMKLISNFRLTLFALQCLLPVEPIESHEVWFFYTGTFRMKPPSYDPQITFPAFEQIFQAWNEKTLTEREAAHLAIQIFKQHLKMRAVSEKVSVELQKHLTRVPLLVGETASLIAYRGATKRRRPSRYGGSGSRKKRSARRSPRGNARKQRSHSRRSHGRLASRTRRC